jgi:hypothetical protein
MSDLTLSFLVNADAPIVDARQSAMRHAEGDVIDAMRSDDVADFDGTEWKFRRDTFSHRRLAYLHLRGVPDRFAAEPHRLTEELRRAKPTAEDPGDYEVLRLRRFRVVRSNLPQRARDEIRTNGETTMTWLAVRTGDVIRTKSAVLDLDPLADLERAIRDSD